MPKRKITYNFFPENNHIRCRIKWKTASGWNIVSTNIPYKIDSGKWSRQTMRCKNNTFHYGVSAQEINREINDCQNRADQIFDNYKADNLPDIVEFKKEWYVTEDEPDQPTEHNFFEVLDLFIKKSSVEKSWSVGTQLKFKALKNYLYDWNCKLQISDINNDTMLAFVTSKVRKKYQNTSILKDIKNLKWFMRWAKRNGYTGTNIDEFTPRLKGTDGKVEAIVYLTWNELTSLFNFDFSYNKSLEQVRDVFCFCCFTGLRYSDVVALQRSDIHEDYISIVTQKTTENIKIEFNKYSKSIADKYSKCEYKSHKALPVISNQKMNHYLKMVAKAAGICEMIKKVYYIGNERHEHTYEKWELITTHCGRRTFVVNALYLGIPAEVVMKWTGHSDYESMKPYIAIVDDLKTKSMSLFDRD